MKHKKKSPLLPALIACGLYFYMIGCVLMSEPVKPPVKQVKIARVIEETKPVELFSAKNALIDYVMHDIEGGSKYVKDGCGYAKYGINSCYNKDVNVKNLTARKAAKIYVDRYWDEKLDSYPAAFQLVAFDALVNHGNDDTTWQMIKAANASPSKRIKRRRAYYSTLANYKEHKAGWNSRLVKLTEYKIAGN